MLTLTVTKSYSMIVFQEEEGNIEYKVSACDVFSDHSI